MTSEYAQANYPIQAALAADLMKGVSRMDHLIAITNPSDESAEAGFVETKIGPITVERIIPEYGDKIENGAQIVIVSDDPIPSVWQYIAERVDDDIWIRVNNTIADYVDTEDVGPSVAEGTGPQAVPTPAPGELETYTVFGSSDDGERDTHVCTAESPEQAVEQTKPAVLADEGYEHLVTVDIVLKGDHSDAEAVNV